MGHTRWSQRIQCGGCVPFENCKSWCLASVSPAMLDRVHDSNSGRELCH